MMCNRGIGIDLQKVQDGIDRLLQAKFEAEQKIPWAGELDAKGKEIARRNFKGILVPYQGKVSNPLWLQDIQCAGPLVFHAKFRGKEVKGQVSLDCGE